MRRIDRCGGLSLPDCGRQIYESNAFNGDPGAAFAYNEVHLQLAAAMAVAAAGDNVSFVELVQQNVFDRAGGMPSTIWTNQLNPAAGAGEPRRRIFRRMVV